jgi:hypothetical protein
MKYLDGIRKQAGVDMWDRLYKALRIVRRAKAAPKIYEFITEDIPAPPEPELSDESSIWNALKTEVLS